LVDPMTKDDFDALRKKIVGDLRKFEKRAPFEGLLQIYQFYMHLFAKQKV
jgi:hypothetical protein